MNELLELIQTESIGTVEETLRRRKRWIFGSTNAAWTKHRPLKKSNYGVMNWTNGGVNLSVCPPSAKNGWMRKYNETAFE